MKSFVCFTLPVLVALSLLSTCKGAKILVAYIVGSKSHLLAVMPIVEELAIRGHEITLVTPFKVPINDSSMRMIYLADLDAQLHSHPFDWFEMSKQGPTQIFTFLNRIKAMIFSGYECLKTNREFQELIEKKDIDLILIDAMFNEFFGIYLEQLKVPFVMHSSSVGFCVALQPMGVSMDYAAVPTGMTEFGNPMSFRERFSNAIQSELVKYFMNYLVFRPLEARIRVDIPDARPLMEIKGDASLLILNSHPATAWPRSLPPNVIAIGAVHARPAKPLIEPFKTFTDESNDGFIIFTLGTLVKVSSMSKETLQAFINAFSKLPQRVIWKWEAEIPANLPSNIMMTKWLPQQDLLGHLNARVFITHGGLLGFQEAIYHAVPMLMLPFGNDQKANAAKAGREGFGLKLDWENLDEEKISNALGCLIKDPGFRRNATRLSQLMRDELIPGKETGAYWIEHVIRQKGAKHLKIIAKDMPIYQRYLFDVIFVLIAMVLASIIFFFSIIWWIISKCRRMHITASYRQAKNKDN